METTYYEKGKDGRIRRVGEAKPERKGGKPLPPDSFESGEGASGSNTSGKTGKKENQK
jgi:hypothetical protein